MLKELQQELFNINPFVQVYKSAKDREKVENQQVLKIYIHNTHGKDMRQYNTPTTNEIAAIIVDQATDIKQKRDILIIRQNNKLFKISELHGAYDPLQYPLLFPFGEYGWHDEILRANVQEKSDNDDDNNDDDNDDEQSTTTEQSSEQLSKQYVIERQPITQMETDELFATPEEIQRMENIQQQKQQVKHKVKHQKFKNIPEINKTEAKLKEII